MKAKQHQNILESIDDILTKRLDKQQIRKLSVQNLDSQNTSLQSDKRLLDFSSNDYLALSTHPLLKARAIEYIKKFGCGAKSSRLITGNLACYPHLEKKIARLKGKEAALILNTGYQANLSLLSSLLNKNTIVFADKLCHHSLLMGAKLGDAPLIRYRHNDYEHLAQTMAKQAANTPMLIMTESVFGMDGDCADLEQLIAIKKKYNALLYVDEAHATGVLGKHGSGLAAFKDDIDLVMGTFSKALGSFGAYVACSQKLKDYFINCCGGFIYSTALPPPVLGSIDAALELLPQLDEQRKALKNKAHFLRKKLSLLGLDCGNSQTHIVPLIIHEEEKALRLAKELRKMGILSIAIRPPTVPQFQSRIRFALSTLHSEEDILSLFQALKDSFLFRSIK